MSARVATALTLVALLSSGCGFCGFLEVGDPEPVEVGDFAPLPVGYEIRSTQGSCGQGRRPVDCARVAEIERPANVSLDDAVDELRSHVGVRGWEACDNKDSFAGRCYEVASVEAGNDMVKFVFSHRRDDC